MSVMLTRSEVAMVVKKRNLETGVEVKPEASMVQSVLMERVGRQGLKGG